MSALVFLDTETTGLDWQQHDVVEVAWAVGDGEIFTFYPWHTLENAQPEALEINGYFRRDLDRRHTDDGNEQLERMFLRDLRGATIVGSNPAFDTAMLRRKFGFAPWHHRLFDVAAYAAGVFGWAEIRGLAAVAEVLREDGYKVEEPDHTAHQDVVVLRQVHHALVEWAINR